MLSIELLQFYWLEQLTAWWNHCSQYLIRLVSVAWCSTISLQFYAALAGFRCGRESVLVQKCIYAITGTLCDGGKCAR